MTDQQPIDQDAVKLAVHDWIVSQKNRRASPPVREGFKLGEECSNMFLPHPPQGEAEMRDGLVRLREWLLQLPIPTPGVVPQIRNVDAILALTGRGKGDE